MEIHGCHQLLFCGCHRIDFEIPGGICKFWEGLQLHGIFLLPNHIYILFYGFGRVRQSCLKLDHCTVWSFPISTISPKKYRLWSIERGICHLQARRFVSQIHRSIWWWKATHCLLVSCHTWPDEVLCLFMPFQVSGSLFPVPPYVVGFKGCGACPSRCTHAIRR